VIELRATPALRRAVLLAAVSVVALEVGLFAFLWRIGTLADPGGDRRAALAFVALGTAVTLQATAVVGVLWVLVAMAWTTLVADAAGWSLEHPWRTWQGQPRDVSRAWRQSGWIAIELDGHWRRWYVRAGGGAEPTVAALRSQLPAGVWLDAGAVRAHLMRTVLPLVLAAIGLGGLALMWMLETLDGLMHVTD
jgi:hypothetical protein